MSSTLQKQKLPKKTLNYHHGCLLKTKKHSAKDVRQLLIQKSQSRFFIIYMTISILLLKLSAHVFGKIKVQ